MLIFLFKFTFVALNERTIVTSGAKIRLNSIAMQNKKTSKNSLKLRIEIAFTTNTAKPKRAKLIAVSRDQKIVSHC